MPILQATDTVANRRTAALAAAWTFGGGLFPRPTALLDPCADDERSGIHRRFTRF
ncbi:MAG: hypothetical protein AVDCRST_MAG77-251 [uncultured Chloroflexi bacterium]|uniref:Uncharacterized protein n=1 Tax=uncultured Chloroflexota bacterium TaxID=166587 RepID=A0A6J4H8L6_9CHLR|nr:MAG: hypothetical protein AVDCRST_MAG77-251 [uncultured Chloroflexota bacterium]